MTLVKKADIRFFITFVVLIIAIAAFGGCAQQPQINSVADQIGVAYATIEGVSNSVALHVEAGVLAPDKAAVYRDKLVEAKKLVDASVAAQEAKLPQNSLEALQLANKLLFDLQIELQKQVEGGGP